MTQESRDFWLSRFFSLVWRGIAARETRGTREKKTNFFFFRVFGVFRGRHEREPAVGGNRGVNLAHQAQSFIEGDHDLAIMGDVLVCQGAAWRFADSAAVVQSFVADLVPAVLKVPDFFRQALEIGALTFEGRI